MPRRPRQRGPLAFLGPGLITGASDDDPSGIATYSQVGAQFGYGMAWVMLFTWPLMAAIQEISARIGRVTGEGIAGNIRAHYPRLAAARHRRSAAGRRTSSISAPISARWVRRCSCCSAARRVFMSSRSPSLCALLEIFSRYESYVRILKWTSVSLFAYVATALVVDVPWARGRLSYPCAEPQLEPDYLVAIVAVLGTTITPYCFFWQSSEEAEDERDRSRRAPADATRPKKPRRRSDGSASTPISAWGFPT